MWDVISATGEWAGAIAVVASLLYLAKQGRLSNEQSRAAARYSFLEAYGTANAAIGESKENAEVLSRGLRDDDLDEGERMQFLILLGQFFNTWSVMYDLHSEGQLPEGQWKIVRTDIKAILAQPGGRAMWHDIMRHNVDDGFKGWVDSLEGSDETTYEFSARPRGR